MYVMDVLKPSKKSLVFTGLGEKANIKGETKGKHLLYFIYLIQINSSGDQINLSILVTFFYLNNIRQKQTI